MTLKHTCLQALAGLIVLSSTMIASCNSPSPKSQSSRCEVKSLTLINGDTDEPISGFETIPDGTVLNAAKLPTRNLNIVANLSPDNCADKVDFNYVGTNSTHQDSSPPFTLYGDEKSFLTGKVDYFGFPLLMRDKGKRTFKVTPYNGDNAGIPLTISLDIVDER